MKMKREIALIEIGKDGTFTVFTPDTNSVVFGDGSTVAEAKADFENTVKEFIETYEETGVQDPDDLKNTSFVYKFDLPSFLSYYKFLNMTQLAKYAGINPSLMRQYKRGTSAGLTTSSHSMSALLLIMLRSSILSTSLVMRSLFSTIF